MEWNTAVCIFIIYSIPVNTAMMLLWFAPLYSSLILESHTVSYSFPFYNWGPKTTLTLSLPWPIKVRNLKSLNLFFFFFCISTWKDFQQKVQYWKQLVVRPEYIDCLQACTCTFQPRKFIGWGNERVKKKKRKKSIAFPKPTSTTNERRPNYNEK